MKRRREILLLLYQVQQVPKVLNVVANTAFRTVLGPRSEGSANATVWL